MSKIKSSYESMLVLSTKLSEEATEAMVAKFKDLIEANGTLDNVDVWGKRRLAYLINKEAEGYYVLFTFTSETEFPAELDRIYKITDGVIRSLIIRKPEGAEAPAQEEPKAEEAPVAEEAPADDASPEAAE